jgi:Trk K+ transport system NAD-binding subunit
MRQDLRVFARLFPWRVATIMTVGIALLARLYQYAHNRVEPTSITYVKALFAALNMALFQLSYADMPPGPLLDPFFVLAPLIGIPLFLIFGANIVNILRIFFVRGERGQMWQRALAATIERPIIVCGLGHIGYRVANQLLDLKRPVVGIEAHPSSLINTLMERDMPVILGDIRDQDVLQSAGVARAQTVLICTDLDLVNIEAAFHVRALNERARIVLRLFEDEIADKIQASFNLKAVLSRSALAAQAFAYAAIGLEILEVFKLEQRTYFLARVSLAPTSCLIGDTVQKATQDRHITLVCLQRQGRLIIEPDLACVLQGHDTLFVFGMLDRLVSFIQEAKGELIPLPAATSGEASSAPILVCGLGHTGYRVVNVLRTTLHRQVIALDFEAGGLSERLQEQGVPVVLGDFRQPSVLEQAGIREAAALIACTEDDMLNFETVLRARELMPQIRTVMRIFEEALGRHLQQMFDIDAVYSTSVIAAPDFVYAAVQIHVPQPVEVGDERFFMARLVVEALSNLINTSLQALNLEEELTVLLHLRAGQVNLVPLALHLVLAPGDEIVVLASYEKLQDLGDRNQPLGGLS